MTYIPPRRKRHITPKHSKSPAFGGNEGVSDSNNSENAAKRTIEQLINRAQEAMQTGDRVLAEQHFQRAEHYTRLMNGGVGH